MPKPSILTLLWLIKQRPGMYIGWDDAHRRKQLEGLQAILTGYSLALRQHNVGNEDLKVLGELEAFLRSRSGADNFTGIDQICATSETEQEAWDRVWGLIDEFAKSKQTTLR